MNNTKFPPGYIPLTAHTMDPSLSNPDYKPRRSDGNGGRNGHGRGPGGGGGRNRNKRRHHAGGNGGGNGNGNYQGGNHRPPRNSQPTDRPAEDGGDDADFEE